MEGKTLLFEVGCRCAINGQVSNEGFASGVDIRGLDGKVELQARAIARRISVRFVRRHETQCRMVKMARKRRLPPDETTDSRAKDKELKDS
jgi:hypothetical protein